MRLFFSDVRLQRKPPTIKITSRLTFVILSHSCGERMVVVTHVSSPLDMQSLLSDFTKPPHFLFRVLK